MAEDHPTENTFWGPEIIKKRCTRCKAVKPVGEFHLAFDPALGKKRRWSWCKKCVDARAKKWAASHPEKRNQAARRYLRARSALLSRVTTPCSDSRKANAP